MVLLVAVGASFGGKEGSVIALQDGGQGTEIEELQNTIAELRSKNDRLEREMAALTGMPAAAVPEGGGLEADVLVEAGEAPLAGSEVAMGITVYPEDQSWIGNGAGICYDKEDPETVARCNDVSTRGASLGACCATETERTAVAVVTRKTTQEMAKTKFACMRIVSVPLEGGPGSDALKKAFRTAAAVTCTGFITVMTLGEAVKAQAELLNNWLYYANDSMLHHEGDAAEFSAVVVVAASADGESACNEVRATYPRVKLVCVRADKDEMNERYYAKTAVYLDIPVLVTSFNALQLKPIAPYLVRNGITICGGGGISFFGGNFQYGDFWGGAAHYKAVVDAWSAGNVQNVIRSLKSPEKYFYFSMGGAAVDKVRDQCAHATLLTFAYRRNRHTYTEAPTHTNTPSPSQRSPRSFCSTMSLCGWLMASAP
jgi:gluconate kinase